jgi:hypothetical protein
MRSVTLLAQRLSLPVLFVLVALGCIATARADETVFTNPGWNGTSSICCFGYSNTATYGEVITAPSDGNTQLNSFQFYLNEPAGLTFGAYIAPWNGAYAGPLLYSTPSPIVTAGTGLVPYTVSTGGVNLTASNQYVLFTSISNYYASDSGSGNGAMGGDIFSGGTSSTYFVWANNSGDFASLFTGSWASTGCVGSGCGQAAFVLDYSSPTVTPEVPTVVLFGTGLLGILFVMWKSVLT